VSDEGRDGRLVVGKRAKGRRRPLDGEAGYRYGGRNYIVTSGQGLIAQRGPWHLVAVPSRDRPEWYNFKLYLDQKAKKNLFHIGVSKGQVNVNREVAVLDEHYPDVKEWVRAKSCLYIDGLLSILPERGKRIVYRKNIGWIAVSSKKKK
jgi:hypothetical protein